LMRVLMYDRLAIMASAQFSHVSEKFSD
jgi:hypothetical protein